jgi:hypothetical protein
VREREREREREASSTVAIRRRRSRGPDRSKREIDQLKKQEPREYYGYHRFTLFKAHDELP